ncbi:MAG: hypothetical protein C0592_08105 [Marinilabiliales bacterium]|nr:MAG: hypothetical protein C0592_08105 [Marinilabiliales bacterium]
MVYQEEISQKQQLEWYKNLDPATNLYLIIENNDTSCGLINIKNINPDTGNSESGLFIWKEDLTRSHLPVLASWLLSETGYGIAGGPGTEIKVLKSNNSAIEFNKKMGFNITREENDIVFMYQSKKSFSEATRSSRERFLQGRKEGHEIDLSFNDHENDDFILANFLKLTDQHKDLRKTISDRHYSFTITF